MNRIKLITAGLLLFGCGEIYAQYSAVGGFCVKGATPAVTSGLNSINTLQGIVPGGPAGCLVTVYLTGSVTPATIYPEITGGVLNNPFRASLSGQWLFYASPSASYDVVLSGGIPPNAYVTPITLTDVPAGGGGGSGGPFVSLVDSSNQTMIGELTAPEFSTGAIVGNVFTLDNLSPIPTSWTLNVTSPATALASLGGVSSTIGSAQTIVGILNTPLGSTIGGILPCLQNGTDCPAAGGSGTVTNVSVVPANGVSASVTNPTTIPAITFTLGAITPTSVTGTTSQSNFFAGTTINNIAVCLVNGTNCPVGVSQIIAGTNITISPVGGTGVVTVNVPSSVLYSLGGTLTSANIVLGTGAGAGASLGFINGLDGNHQFAIITGSAPQVGEIIATVTFTASRGHITYPVYNVYTNTPYLDVPNIAIQTPSATSYIIYSGGTALSAGVSYNFNVVCP